MDKKGNEDKRSRRGKPKEEEETDAEEQNDAFHQDSRPKKKKHSRKKSHRRHSSSKSFPKEEEEDDDKKKPPANETKRESDDSIFGASEERPSSSRSKMPSTVLDDHALENRSSSQSMQTSNSFVDGYLARVQTDMQQASERSLSSHSIRHDIDSLLSNADEESSITPIGDNVSSPSRTLEEIADTVRAAARLSSAPSRDIERDVGQPTRDGAGSVGVEEHPNSEPDIEQDSARQQDIEANEETRTQDDVYSAYLAPTPQEIQQQALDNAVDAINVRVHPLEVRQQMKQKRRRRIVAASIGIAVAAALAISLGVTLNSRRNVVPPRSMSPTPAPTSIRFGQAAPLVESFFNTTFEDASTPQYQAVQWIADVDGLFEDLATADPDRFRQRYILALFYFATGGPTSWINTSFFLKPDVHECAWRDTVLSNTHSWSGFVGVVNCSSDDWVERIEINQNNLSGTLSDELGSLSSLSELTVYTNSIGGTLPSSLLGLSTLQILNLWSNDVTGTIPTEVGQATSLSILGLRANMLNGTLPSEIGNMSSLKELALDNNGLTGSLPDTLLRLSNITLLGFVRNSLTGTLPPSLWSSLPYLEDFGVWDNQLSGSIPDNLESVPHLEKFVLQKNNFTGQLPSSIVKLTKVTHFDIGDNAFTGSLPNDWTSLSSTLVALQVAKNRLTGSLPDSLGSLTKLDILNLFENGFSGPLPASLGNLTNLQVLGLDTNRLTGTVPMSFVQLSSLQIMTLNSNELTGDLSFLCNGAEMLFPNQNNFLADCHGEVVCPCCNGCCNIHDTCNYV